MPIGALLWTDHGAAERVSGRSGKRRLRNFAVDHAQRGFRQAGDKAELERVLIVGKVLRAEIGQIAGPGSVLTARNDERARLPLCVSGAPITATSASVGRPRATPRSACAHRALKLENIQE